MRQPMLFLDTGSGWENLTGHEGSQVALDGFTIEWGTDDATKQPDCNVLKFQLLDRTGRLAGNSTRLAGAKVLIQLTRMPLWQDLNAVRRWIDEPETTTWAGFHLEHSPDSTSPMDATALSIFEGNIATGCSIEQREDDGWLLTLNANSRTVRMGRTTQQGPTTPDYPAGAGKHWNIFTANRVDEIQKRLASLDAPQLSSAAVSWLKSTAISLAPYDLDSFPDLSTILYRIASWSSELPLYYERHSHSGTTLDIIHAGARASITLHSDGTLTVGDGWRDEKVITGSQIILDTSTLKLADPVSQVSIKGRKLDWDKSNNQFQIGDAELDITAGGKLPGNLTETIRSVSFDTDAIIVNNAADHWQPSMLAPSQAQRDQWADWLATTTMRLRPEKLTVSTEYIDIDEFEQTFQPSATLFAFVSNRYTRLESDDGTPATSGAWLGIGGTFTFKWRHGKPVMSNEFELQPLPMTPSTVSKWADTTPIGLPWRSVPFTWGEFSQITYFKD